MRSHRSPHARHVRGLALGTAVVLTLAVAPGVVWASGGGEGEHSGGSIKILLLALLNFAVLLGVLWRFAGPAVRSFLFQRRESIRSELEGAREQLAAAEAKIGALNQRLADLDREAADLLQLAQRQGADERERSQRRAQETAERIREEAHRVAEVEIQRARQALREEAALLATSLAAELLRDHIAPEDDARLIGEFTQRVGEATH